MTRLVALLVAVAAAAAMLAAPAATADAGCSAVLADLPVLTDDIQTEWVTQDCSPNHQVRVTLSVLVDGDWQRATCPGNVTGDCTRLHPTDSEDANCDPFYCDGSTHHQTDDWRQLGAPCAHIWRTKVTVYRPNGDVVAIDASPGNTC